MKILLVNDYSTPTGGAEIRMLGVRDGLRERGHDARLFAGSAQPTTGNAADYECFGTLSRFRSLLQTANPFAYVELKRVLAEFRPDVVHVRIFLTQLSPLILPLLRNIPSGVALSTASSPTARPASAAFLRRELRRWK